MRLPFSVALAGIGIFLTGLCQFAAAEPVTLTLAAGNGSQDVQAPIQWTITPIGKTGKPEGKPVAQQTAPVFRGDLKRGPYLVSAALGGAKTQKAIMIGSGNNDRRIFVDGAHLALKMVPFSGAAPISEPITWELYTYVKGATENGRKINSQYAPQVSFDIPGGTYVVRALYKGTKSDLVVPIAAGQGLQYTINLYAGTARLKASSPDKKAVVWQIVRGQPNKKGQYELVNEILDSNPTVTVREGNYLVIAKSGKYWAQTPLSIKAGRQQEINLALRESDAAIPAVVSPGGTVAQTQ